MQMVAIKVESCSSNKQVLKIEALILKRLQDLPHICVLHGCGRTDKVNFIVMTLLGQNLSDLRKKQAKQLFSMSTVLRLGVQALTAVQEMHNCGFLHRDIKPSNFAMGVGRHSRKCYLIDFGLARQYTTPTGELKQPRPIAGFRGTVRYASVNAHLGNELGRHDDLWSVFYMLIELATGSLPWRRIRDKEEAGKAKQDCDHYKLISSLPEEFKLFMDYLKKMTYYDKPDYKHLINLFQTAQQRLGICDSDSFDWESDFGVPSLVNSVSGISLPVVSPEQHFTTPEDNDKSNLKEKLERSVGERVRNICKVFKTSIPQQTTKGDSHYELRTFHANNPHDKKNDKTKQNTSKSHEISTKNCVHRSSRSMQTDTKCSVNNELENQNIPLCVPCEIPVLPADTRQQPKEAFLSLLDMADTSQSSKQTKPKHPLNKPLFNSMKLVKNNTSLSSDAGFPQAKKTELNESQADNASSEHCMEPVIVRTLDSSPQKPAYFTSSLIVPRLPTVPPRSGYFCSSARRRKFVKLGKRMLTNSLKS